MMSFLRPLQDILTPPSSLTNTPRSQTPRTGNSRIDNRRSSHEAVVKETVDPILAVIAKLNAELNHYSEKKVAIGLYKDSPEFFIASSEKILIIAEKQFQELNGFKEIINSAKNKIFHDSELAKDIYYAHTMRGFKAARTQLGIAFQEFLLEARVKYPHKEFKPLSLPDNK